MTTMTVTPARSAGLTSEQRFVIFAASLGTIFEWYDFFLYAALAPFFASLFFPHGNETAALLGAFATYAAGFLMRPFGALVFGRLGDLVGRKYTFLVTIMLMGMSTVLIGLLPAFFAIGWAAPILLVSIRLLQGLALGGEYGGAVIYVAEHAAPNERGYTTSFIQTTATLGLFLALAVILFCRVTIDAASFASWGWRIPFLVSIFLLAFAVYLRLRLGETPIFRSMTEEGNRSRAPLTESLLRYPNNKYMVLALLGATAGQSVVWYTGQFYALYFLTLPLKLDYMTAVTLIGISLMVGTPFFIVFGWLSDRIGRLKIMLAGCLIAVLTYFPLFSALTHFVNPDLELFQRTSQLTVSVDPTTCQHIVRWVVPTPCDSARDFLTRSGLSFASEAGPQGSAAKLTIKSVRGVSTIEGYSAARWSAALVESGYPTKADINKINWLMTELILVIMMIYVAMVYGPIAAFLVELFPTRIRYTSVSLSYHIGNGWFGGALPLVATVLVAEAGNIYFGLWYPILVAAMTVIVGGLFLGETKDIDIAARSASEPTTQKRASVPARHDFDPLKLLRSVDLLGPARQIMGAVIDRGATAHSVVPGGSAHLECSLQGRDRR